MKTRRGFNSVDIEFLIESPAADDAELLAQLRKVVDAFDNWTVEYGGPEWVPRTRLLKHERQLLMQLLLWLAHDAPSPE